MTNNKLAINDTLLPCPFCGHKATFVDTTHWINSKKRSKKRVPGNIYGYVQCRHCLIATPFRRKGKYITLDGARKIWNKRIDGSEDHAHDTDA